MWRMDELIAQIEQFARARGIKPATVIRYAAGLKPSDWRRWAEGGGCSVRTAEKIKEYIVTHSEVGS